MNEKHGQSSRLSTANLNHPPILQLYYLKFKNQKQTTGNVAGVKRTTLPRNITFLRPKRRIQGSYLGVRASAAHQLADHLLQEISIFQTAVRRLQAFGKTCLLQYYSGTGTGYGIYGK
jgi:hypothetical protein